MSTRANQLTFIAVDELDGGDRHLIARLELALHLETVLTSYGVLHYREDYSNHTGIWAIGVEYLPTMDWKRLLRLLRLGYLAQVDMSLTEVYGLQEDRSSIVFALTESGHALGRAILATRPVKLTPPQKD